LWIKHGGRRSKNETETSEKYVTFRVHLLQRVSGGLLCTLVKGVSNYLHGRVISNFVEEEWIEGVSKSRTKRDYKIWNEQGEIRGIRTLVICI
jgi:hypothetical protein